VKQKRQIGVLLILVLIATFVWLLNFRGKPVTADAGPSIQDDDPMISVENPHPRLEDIPRAAKTEYKSSGRNIFSYAVQATVSGAQKPGAAIVPPKNSCGIESGPCPEPPPPPLVLPSNIKFFGFGVVPNGTSRQAFFHDTNGDEVYVVGEGEILLKRFRILRIGNASLEFEEISSGRTGTAPLVEDQAGAPSS
jgi:hypothetical protein